MKVGQLRGVVAAIVTPFDKDGRVDYTTLQRLTSMLIEGGVHGIMATGGTGEFPHLSADERVQATRAIVAGAAGRVPVFANTSSCATDEAVSLASRAAEVGADAIISVPPYYFPLSEAALLGFFTTLADRSPLPLFVYNNPGYTGNPLSPSLLIELLQHPNIAGLKQSESDLGQFVEVVHQVRSSPSTDKCLMTGIDSQLCASLATGGDGIFSTASGIVPKQVVEIFSAAIAGDFDRARDAQLRLQPLNRFLEYDPGYVAPAKEALRMMGWDVGDPRAPLPKLTEAERATLRRALSELRVLPPVETRSS
ncbi:MAG TPA: dihydrodipicolinate synthase family protein [Candidatus Dormibacteraeota bacterium]